MRYVLKSWPVCSPSSKEMKFILLFTLKKLAKTIRIWNLRKYSGAGAASANILPVERGGARYAFFGRLSRPRRRAIRIRRTCACSPIPKRSPASLMRDYGSAFLEHAPAVVLVEGDRTATDLWRENAAITATALLFAATDAGLASCWVHVNGRPCLKDQPDGAQAEDYLREFLPVPAGHGILCAVALGYSDFEPAALPPFDAGTHIHWPEKQTGSDRVRGGRVSGRTSFGRFMSLAGACIGNPAGFDFLGLNLSFSRRKSGSSNKKTATEGLRFFCFGTPCHFLLKRFIVRSGPIAANEIASPKY